MKNRTAPVSSAHLWRRWASEALSVSGTRRTQLEACRMRYACRESRSVHARAWCINNAPRSRMRCVRKSNVCASFVSGCSVWDCVRMLSLVPDRIPRTELDARVCFDDVNDRPQREPRHG
ncbi:hypothetical protein MRX96_003665 [Rhipicephalus microplus]